jgi:hypothetical protein
MLAYSLSSLDLPPRSRKTNLILRLWRSRANYEKALFLLFLLSLPFLHPVVNGDGVGYYAYIRSPLIDHNFSFSSDFRNPEVDLEKIFLTDHFIDNPVTKTGHLPNFYAVGPAVLWSPFLLSTHLVVLGLGLLGWQIPPDGHSWPYLATMTGATALYGFAGLCFSFAIARKFVEERWAFWATIGLWFASSVPVYIYLLPAWSHAHSLFTTSLFLWYWLRTRSTRTSGQWLKLGLLSGLMIDVYQLNGVFLIAVAYDALSSYAAIWSAGAAKRELYETLHLHGLCGLGALLALLPQFVTRQIVFGNFLSVGPYALSAWNWTSPVFVKVLFSTDHGMFVFTPLLVMAIAGLFYLWRLNRTFGTICLLITLVFYCLISCFPWWYGNVGFGNRFFVSLTPIFISGLASLFAWLARFWDDARAASFRLIPLTLLLVIWNLGLVYQWQTHLIPRYGPVDWQAVRFNQFRVVPPQALHDLGERFYLHCNLQN